jgi:excisionase family DNA binding protein
LNDKYRGDIIYHQMGFWVKKLKVRRYSMALECRTVSVEQAAEILGISRGSAYSLAKAGTLPTVRLGRRLLVPKAALDRLLGEIDHLRSELSGEGLEPAPFAQRRVTDHEAAL